MTSQFSPKVSEILAFSREEATRLASSSVGPEHLLLGILREKNSPVLDLFKQLSINTQTVKEELEEKVREDELSEPIQTSELVLNTQASNILACRARSAYSTYPDGGCGAYPARYPPRPGGQRSQGSAGDEQSRL